ncbi:MAG: dipeptidase [Planctomycetota bacterium]
MTRHAEMRKSANPYLLDCHVDTMLRVVDDGADLAAGIPEGHLDLDRLERAGVRVVVFACWPSTDYLPDQSFARTVALAEAVHRQAELHRDRMELARRVGEARRIVSEGKVAAMLGVEGGHAIEEDLGKLRALAELGVRYMTLTWNNHLSWAESCQRRHDGVPKGLTEFGQRVVREMHRLGIVTDLAHVSPRTFADVLGMDLPPPMCSHSAARALRDHRRNLHDDQIEALSRHGGAMGLTLVPAFLSENPDLNTAVEHALHILRVGGPKSLGIGTDFDGIKRGPAGLEDCSALPKLLGEIGTRGGLTPEELADVAHGNLLRVLEAWE